MTNLSSQLESLLFVSAKPVALKQLVDLTGATNADLEAALLVLTERYAAADSGLALLHNNSKYQLVTKTDNSELIKKFLDQEINSDLSRPSLETLTIIAYRGPIAKADLDRIRGINCSMILRNLLLRGLVESRGDKKDGDTYYQVTFDFLKFLGVSSLEQLPDYDRLHNDTVVAKFLSHDDVSAESVAQSDLETLTTTD
jgi:segregation and condensation protein B